MRTNLSNQRELNKLPVRNQTDTIRVCQRLFYPDHVQFVRGLDTLRTHIDNYYFGLPTMVRFYLQSLYRNAQGLGLYADYIGHTSLVADGVTYGATEDAYPVGGGEGYPAPSDRHTVTVVTDDELKLALQSAQSGDVIYIRGDLTVDMTDWIIGGEAEGFSPATGKIKYEMVIPEGVTLMGDRGRGDKKGAILLFTSYTDIAIRMQKKSRISGLCIQGPDTPAKSSIPAQNHSVGILIEGDGARVDNCEITGFSRQCILVRDCRDVEIDHNFIHHLFGESGIALQTENAAVSAHHNLFAEVCTLAHNVGGALAFENNVVTNNVLNDALFVSDGDLSVKNNTFLCAGSFAAAGSYTAEKNLFAYASDVYGAVGDDAFDIFSPQKADGAAMDCIPYLPTEKILPDFGVSLAHMRVLGANFYALGSDAAYRALADLIAKGNDTIKNAAKESISAIINCIGEYTNYLDYSDVGRVTFQIDGETYGARPDEMGPIGGGVGYKKIFTEKDADFIVRTADELVEASEKYQEGDVIFIPENIKRVTSSSFRAMRRSICRMRWQTPSDALNLQSALPSAPTAARSIPTAVCRRAVSLWFPLSFPSFYSSSLPRARG